MRFKLTILLIILNLTVFAFIVYMEKFQSTEDRFEQAERLILQPDLIEGIDHIEISGPALTKPWTIENQDGNWLVSSPYSWEANHFAVDRLLLQLRSFRWVSRFSVNEVEDAGQSLAQYGLNDPTVTIELRTNAETVQIPIGIPTEIGNRLYVLSPDKSFIYVVDRNIFDALQNNLEAFLDRHVFNLNIEQTRAIQVQNRSNGSARVRIVKSQKGWQFVSPIETAASTDQVRSLVNMWQSYEIETFVPPTEVSEDAFASPDLRLTLEGLNTRETLLISTPETGSTDSSFVLAKRERFPTVFKIPARFLDSINTAQDALREKRIMRDLPTGWSSLEIRMDDEVTSLQRLENGKWQVVFTDQSGSLQSLPAEPSLILNLKEAFPKVEAIRFVSDAPSEADLLEYGILNPQRILTFRFEDNQTLELRIGNIAKSDALFYASLSTNSSVFLIRPYILSQVPLNPLHYRDRTLYSLTDMAQISNIRLTYIPTGEILIDEKNEALQDSISSLRSFFRHSRVKEFIKEEFTDPLLLDPETPLPFTYELSAAIKLNGSGDEEAINRRFLLSDRVGASTQFIADPSSGLVGIATNSLIKTLEPFLQFAELSPPDELLEDIQVPQMNKNDEDNPDLAQ